MSIAALVLNFNTASLTAACVESLLADPAVARVLVLDNGSNEADRIALRERLAGAAGVSVIEASCNHGFAGGCNLGIARLLEDPAVQAVCLLNSDAQLCPGGLTRMAEAAGARLDQALVGARMLKPDGQIDSLGIAFFWSCLASNRTSTGDRHFGPTGGCALIGRTLFEDLQRSHGHVFAEAFFCYAEDTDLVARLRLLGYQPSYVDEVVAIHAGQASSGGGFNDFVLYHGIRNSIWMMLRCVPWPILLAMSPLILALHGGILVRHGLAGRWRVVGRLYRDALVAVPRVLRERRSIQRTRRAGTREFMRGMTPRFYDTRYLLMALSQLIKPGQPGR